MLLAETTGTFGIDLAAQPARTGVCRIDWADDGSGYVHCPGGHGEDADLLAMMERIDITRVGIDAPFGWPTAFVDALLAYRERGEWPDQAGADGHEQMRLRATDWAVKETVGLMPLSVSTDRIAVAAMRCARLLSAFHSTAGIPINRTGAGRFVEVYPAAALRRWGLSPKLDLQDPGSYKGADPAAANRRRRLVERIVEAAEGWLEIPEKAIYVCCDDDNCLDAMLSALVARATEIGQAEPVGPHALADSEGRIVLPHPGSLDASCRRSTG